MSRRLLVLSCVWCVLGGACAPKGEPVLTLAPDRTAFDGRTERVSVRVRAFDPDGEPSGGLVSLTATVGHFVGPADLVLEEGAATATFACNPNEEPACLGSMRITGAWNGQTTTVQVIGTVESPPPPVKWDVVPTGVPVQLHAMAVTREGFVWAVGERGVVLRLEGSSWRRMFSGVGTALWAITLDASGAPIIGGDHGVVLRWSGTEFTPWPTPSIEDDVTALGFDSRGALVVGARSGLVYFDRGGELNPSIDLGTAVTSMVARSDGLWVTGTSVLAKYVDGFWLTLPSPATGTLRRAFGGESALWLMGDRAGAQSRQGLVVSGPMPNWKTTALPAPVTGLVEVPFSAERFAFGGSRLFRQLNEGDWADTDCPSEVEAGASRQPEDLVLVGPPGISLIRRR
jgi:hypothetical protein